MRKRLLLSLAFLLLIPIIFAQDWVFNSEYLELNLDISGKVSLIPSSPNYNVDYVTANLSFIPRDDFQEEVLDIKTEPSAGIKDNTAIFKWDKPKERELKF